MTTPTIEELLLQIESLKQQLDTLQAASQSQEPVADPPSQPADSSTKGLKIATPDIFDGTMSKADTFLKIGRAHV